MSARSRFSIALARFSAALAVLAAVVMLGSPPSALAVERTVSVEAKATVKVPNDSASIGLGVTLERGSRGAALRAVSAKLHKVIAAVQKIPGVGAGDIVTGRVSVRKTDRRFRASEGISVTLHEPSKAGELVQAAIGAGATGVRGPDYFVGDTEAAYAKALGAAFQKAKAKAATLAAQAGATLGAALQINEGGNPEIVPAGAKEEGGEVLAPPPCVSVPETRSTPAATAKRAKSGCGAPPPTKPGVSTVTATVGVVFELR
jgi:uncharacterized protein YggE